MTRTQFDHWLNKLKQAWEQREPDQAMALCAPELEYYEDPFTPPYTTPQQIKKVWQEVPRTQKNISVDYHILVVTKIFGLAEWEAHFTRQDGQPAHLKGIYQVWLNHQGLCTKFKQWYMAKPLHKDP